MKVLSALVVLTSLVGSNGFMVPAADNSRVGALLRAETISGEDVDFDAPTQRAAEVGNVIRTPTIGFGDFQFGVPRFLANAFGTIKKNSVREELFLEDEECYLGKNGNLDDCADFDPPHNVSP